MSIFKSISSIQEMKLRSQNSEPILLRFFNCAKVEAELLWINYEGRFERYRILKPNQFTDVNTFSGHYWVIRENNTDRTLLLNNQEYFCAEEHKLKDYRHRIPRNSTKKMRIVVVISKPIPPLKSIVIGYLSNRILHCSDVKLLEIPATLKREIIDKIHQNGRSIHSNQEDKDTCMRHMNPSVAIH